MDNVYTVRSGACFDGPFGEGVLNHLEGGGGSDVKNGLKQPFRMENV